MTSNQQLAFQPADRVDRVPPSGIRRFFELAEQADDVISLGVGEPDFTAPWPARKAAINALERGQTSYTANRGRAELRAAIAADVKRRYGVEYAPETEILVTTGVSEAVDLAMRAFLNPGDTVVVPAPTYVSYRPAVVFAEGEPLAIDTSSTDFRLTRETLEDAGAADADALLMCYPNNPTGAVMSRSELEPIAAFARKHDLFVVSDEIYAELTYGHEHVSIASLPGMRDRTIVLNGFSKAYAMTGFRLGYALGPPTAIEAMNKIHQYTMLSAPTTAQHAALEALRGDDQRVTTMIDEYDRRRQYVLSRLEELGWETPATQGAFYVFPSIPGNDAEAFAEDLLTEAGVAVVPGTAFGDAGEGRVRISYAADIETLRAAFDRIEAFLADQ